MSLPKPAGTLTMESQTHDPQPVVLSDTDRVHLAWVAWLHYLAGFFFAAAGLIFLASLGLALWVILAPPAEASEPEMISSAKLLAGLSVIMLLGCWVPAAMLIVLGWLLGHCKAYRLCMWLTGVQSVILFPFGPILGVYVYKVANRPGVRAKFDENTSLANG